jgi:hypothetical protein
MSEVTGDPAIDKLARFTPNASSLDCAEILFRAGSASARTPRGWKVACTVLLLANLALIAERVLRDADPPVALVPGGSQRADPAVPVLPAPIPEGIPEEHPALWSLAALHHSGDASDLPQSPTVAALSPSEPPLTPRSRGEID